MSDAKGDPVNGYLPVMYEIEGPYWEGLRRQRLLLQRCLGCGKVRYPIGPLCPQCLSEDSAWAEMSGEGVVSTCVTFWKAWAPWLESRVPYVVAQVELAEGPRLTANILGLEPAQVHIGLEVSAVFERRTDEVTLLQFAPRGVALDVGALRP